MVDELKKAVKKAEELSRQGQNVIAQMILDEINWGETFQKTQKRLSNLAEEALLEFKSGKTKPFDLGK